MYKPWVRFKLQR